MILSADILAVLIYILAVIVFIHSYKFRGSLKTLLLFFGFLVVGGGIENVNITFGGYYYPGSPLTFYLLMCPIWVWLGWWLIAYCGSFIAHTLVGKGRGSLSIIGIGTELENGIDKQFIKDSIIRAALGAYISMLIGLIMDPTAAAQGWWVWKVDNIYINGVPFGNYLGWFFVVFWTLFLYDIVIAWYSTKGKKKNITTLVWAVASVVALILAGLLLMSSTFAFGIDGIRTDNRSPLMDLILNVKWEVFLIAMITVFISIGLVLVSQFALDKLPEPRPSTKVWYILPSIILLIYWVVMMIATFLTSSLLVAAGLINAVPLFLITFYIIKNPYVK